MSGQTTPRPGRGGPSRYDKSLDVFFNPTTVAVVGATEVPGRIGRAVLKNLITSPMGRTIFPINPGRRSVLGVRAYPTLAAAPLPVELAVIATPAPTVPELVGQCVAAGVKGAIIMAEGFDESTPAGQLLVQELKSRIAGTPLRIVGPNSAGIAFPRGGLNATFAPAEIPAGGIGILSQCGSLLTALLDGNLPKKVGVSAFVSVGSLLDIGWAEWIARLAADPDTECISIYMERLDDPRGFFAAVREVSPHQPVIVVKAGRVPDDPSSEYAFDEMCRDSGAVRVHRLGDLFRMAEILAARPAPGGRLAILTNARGPAILAADAVRLGGGRLAQMFDVGNDADADKFAEAAAHAVADPDTDALLVLLAPHGSMDSLRAAREVCRLAGSITKPVLACWLWQAASPACRELFRAAGVPSFESPEAAVSAFDYLCQHSQNQTRLAGSKTELIGREAIPVGCP
jgi:acetyltransferase